MKKSLPFWVKALAIEIVWILILVISQIPLFPCEEFVSDSTQGYYPALCPLRDEDGYFIVGGNPGYYDSIANVWTWIAALFWGVGLPFLLARWLKRRKADGLSA